MNFAEISAFPLWLFVLFVTLLCFALSGYLTFRRKKAIAQAISGQKPHMPRQAALVLGRRDQPRLSLLKFCPACGKAADTPGCAGSCEFCGYTLEQHALSQR